MKKSADPTFQWIKPDGTPTQYFNEVIQALIKNSLTKPVSTTDPTNGQVLVYNSTTGQYTPGAN